MTSSLCACAVVITVETEKGQKMHLALSNLKFYCKTQSREMRKADPAENLELEYKMMNHGCSQCQYGITAFVLEQREFIPNSLNSRTSTCAERLEKKRYNPIPPLWTKPL